MRSFIFRSTSFLSKQVLPSSIILALVFAPFPPLLPPGTQEQNAKEAYESTYGLNNTAPTIVARYTRGVSEPVITKDTTESVVSLVIDPNAIPLPLVAETVEQDEVEATAKLATTRSVRISAGAQANIAAAQQVAAGTSASEIVEVGLDQNLNIAETVDTHGARTLAEYNEAGDPIKITAPDGTATYYAYDEDQNLISMYSEKSNVVARAGENPIAFISRLITSSVRALAGEDAPSSTSLAYEEGAITEVGNGNTVVSFEYDADGNLGAQETDSGESIVYAYDENGNIAGKEVRTLDTTIAENAFTRVLSHIGLTGLARSYARAYADEGTLAQSEAYAYDASGGLSAFAVSLGEDVPVETPPVQQAPEIRTAPVLESASSTPATTTTEAVPVVELPTISMPEATSTVEAIVSFLTSPFTQLARLVAPFVPRAFADTLSEIVAPVEEVPTPMAASAKNIGVWNTRDVLGNVIETQNEKGEITAYRLDPRTDAPIGRTVYDPQDTVLIDISYGFNSSTNRWTSRTEAGTTESYTYDERGELTEATGNTASTYRYDEHGNRVEKLDASGVTTYTYSGNRLEKETSAQGATRTYAYDALGNVESSTDSIKGTTRFSYDVRGAVSRIELPDGTVIRYTYDALNRRIGKSIAGPLGSESLTYRYEGANLTRVVGTDGTTVRQYFYDPKNNLIAITTGGSTYSVVLDSHGSVVALTDKDSKVAAHFSYDAWGAPTSSLRTDLTDFYYASGFYEPLVGMYLLGPRTYDPSTGRFLQKDPLAGSLMDVISQNEYLYAGNDPINRTDPSGHQSVEANVGSSPRALAAQARAAAEEMGAVVDAARARVAELTASNAPLEQILVAEAAYEEAKGAQKDMVALARENEARVGELEAAALAAIALPVTPVVEATTTPSVVVPTDSATSTVPILVPSLPETTATTTAPETVVPAPTPESVPTITSEPAPVVAAPEPITFIEATGHVILSAFKEFVPFAFARKKSKSKPAKKQNPPPKPKKSKAKEPPTPPKLTKKQKQEQAKREVLLLTRSLAKLTKALVELNKTRAEQKPIALPTVAKVTEGTKVQVKEVAVAPAMPSAKKDELAALSAGATVSKPGTSFVSSVEKWVQEGASALYDQSPAWKYAMDNPLVVGAAVGVGAGAAAYVGAAGVTAASVQYLGGIGASCAALCGRISEVVSRFGTNPVTQKGAELVTKLENVTLSTKVVEHMTNPSRSVPTTILKEVILAGNKLPDPQGTSAVMYYGKVFINGKIYNIEVLYSHTLNMIQHFKYTSDAIGPLLKI